MMGGAWIVFAGDGSMVGGCIGRRRETRLAPGQAMRPNLSPSRVVRRLSPGECCGLESDCIELATARWLFDPLLDVDRKAEANAVGGASRYAECTGTESEIRSAEDAVGRSSKMDRRPYRPAGRVCLMSECCACALRSKEIKPALLHHIEVCIICIWIHGIAMRSDLSVSKVDPLFLLCRFKMIFIARLLHPIEIGVFITAALLWSLKILKLSNVML